jgi:predicted alpha/beta-hydrolase family hydrolase
MQRPTSPTWLSSALVMGFGGCLRASTSSSVTCEQWQRQGCRCARLNKAHGCDMLPSHTHARPPPSSALVPM